MVDRSTSEAMLENGLGINVLVNGIEPILFDIVAIHGLNGDPFETWTHQDSHVLWLRDLLPEVLPNVRVMTFGYNARFKNFTDRQDLRNIAAKLLTELVDVREGHEKSRPILFICHSLGGIVAKKALLIGCGKEEEQIQRAVHAIFFLGTPHNGSSLAKLGKLVANVVAACSPINPAQSLVAMLQKDSEVLFEITEDFIKRRWSLHLVSFYETKMTHIAPFYKRMVVERHSAVLNIPDEVTIGQASDHRQIVRFSSIHDRTFRPILSRLRQIEAQIEAVLHPGAVQRPEIAPRLTHEFIRIKELQAREKLPFDIPIAPCSPFLGRIDILNQMQCFFYEHDPAEIYARRTFALCGLGGSGKTQTALQFVSHNAARYPTGVMFANAASQVSLEADFARIHDFLRLQETNDKARSVRYWLSMEEHSEWLLVFDNADDLTSVHLSKYLPGTLHGHVLITSRDQEAIGGVAEDGLILDSLTPEEATSLLLGTAGVRRPSDTDIQSAREVVERLGFLPLAVAHAGAFMRSRQKSPQQYCNLYIKAQHELLGFRPRLAISNETVLSAWELNFQQIETDRSGAADLLSLFTFLSPSRIEESMLQRGSSLQKRWNEDGEPCEVPAEAEGVETELVRLIQDEMNFDAAVEKLKSFSFLSSRRDNDGLRIFSIHPLIQYCATQRLSPQSAMRWMIQALFLVCHAFPRNKYLEPTYGQLGRAMLPHLAHVLVALDKLELIQDAHLVIKQEVAATLLAASRFSNVSWKKECIARATDMLKPNSSRYLRALLAYRESSVLRMSGDVRRSEATLRSYVRMEILPEIGVEEDLTARYNAQRGDLIISFSENLIQQQRLKEGKAELKIWQPLNPLAPSTLEGIVLRARNITLGKILRYQGQFKDALEVFQTELNKSVEDDFFEGSGWFRVLLSNISDIYCELGQPGKGAELLQKELEPMIRNGTQNIATGTRLRLSLAETFIQRGDLGAGEDLLMQLKFQHDSSNDPDLNPKKNLFQILVGLARIYHCQLRWNEALAYWQHAQTAAVKLDMRHGWNAGVIQLSIAYILHRVGESMQSHSILAEAKNNLHCDTCFFWIPGLSSLWYHEVKQNMDVECNCASEKGP